MFLTFSVHNLFDCECLDICLVKIHWVLKKLYINNKICLDYNWLGQLMALHCQFIGLSIVELCLHMLVKWASLSMHHVFVQYILLVSYIRVISKHFHLIVTIIKHINVFQNIYMQQLVNNYSFGQSTCSHRYQRVVIGLRLNQ